MIVCHLTAVAKNFVIGKDNKLPWHLPEDLKFFKEKTINKVMIMGRKTFESLGKPLPKRFHIVITRNRDYKYDHPQVVVVSSYEEAIKLAKTKIQSQDEEVFVIGGGEIYKQTLSQVDRLYLTLLDDSYDGTAYYPPDYEKYFTLTKQDSREGFSFCQFDKK